MADKKLMRILLVKLTSMGDVLHALTALTDLQQHYPNAKVDWIVDESFHEIATWHPLVENVFKSAHRRWKKNIRDTWRTGEFKQFLKAIRANQYDYIIDGQGNHKSAVVTWLSGGKGNKHGMDKASVREFAAHLAYDHTYQVPKAEHAITRLRQLFANIFQYTLPKTPAQFGIDSHRFTQPDINLPERYLLFVHSASWQSKLWPEAYWQRLIALARGEGWSIVLPSGSAAETARAERLAGDDKAVLALPRLPLSEVAYIINQAAAAVCVDTGLSHLAGALNRPAITLYGPTDANLIGTTGKGQQHLQADFPCAPCYHKTCQYQLPTEITPACYHDLSPQMVWRAVQQVMVS